jgi:hypothetical protein
MRLTSKSLIAAITLICTGLHPAPSEAEKSTGPCGGCVSNPQFCCPQGSRPVCEFPNPCVCWKDPQCRARARKSEIGPKALPIARHPQVSGSYNDVKAEVAGPCAGGGYRIAVNNRNDYPVRAALCKRTVTQTPTSVSFNRSFQPLLIPANSAADLGCSITANSVSHEFRVAWFDRDFGYVPSNPTLPYQSLVAHEGRTTTIITNHNRHKAVRVTIRRSTGQRESVTLDPWFSGSNSIGGQSPVIVEAASFILPFESHSNSECTAPSEQSN